MAERKITSKEILELLRERHRGDLGFAEVRGAGYSQDSSRSIDFWTLAPEPSRGCPRCAYEIKVSRSDFSRELRQPLKRRPAMLYANQFYFVAPAGVIAVEKLPLGSGLMEVHRDRTGGLYLRTIASAPWLDTGAPSWRFVAGLLRKARREGKEVGRG